MAIWFSSGVRPRALRARRCSRFALAGAAGGRACWRWSSGPGPTRRRQSMRDRYERRSDLSRVAPGQFQTSARRQPRVLHRAGHDRRRAPAATSSSRRSSGNRRDRSPRRAAAASRTSATTRFLVLEQRPAQRAEPDDRREDSARFESYGAQVGERRRSRSATTLPPKARPTARRCCATRRAPNQGELAWRLGLLLGGAQPRAARRSALSSVNPRRASNWNLLFALLGFVVYYNLINLAQAWVGIGPLRHGRLHAGAARRRAAALGAAVVARAHNNWGRRAARRAAGAATAPRMKTIRRLLYVDIVSAVGLRRARLPVAVLLHRLRRRAAATSASAATPRCTQALATSLLLSCRATSTSCCRSRC